MEINLETPWDVIPDATSEYEIYDVDDQLFVGNNTDSLRKYDRLDFELVGGDAPKGNVIIVYKSRLMIGGDRDFPSRIWFSNLGNGEGWSRTGDWFDIYPEDGGTINSFAIQNDELVISKNTGRKYGLRIYEDDTPKNSRLRVIEGDKGDASNKANDTTEDVHFFFDRSGMFTIPKLEGSGAGGLSYIVEEIVKGMSPRSLTKVAVGSFKGKVYASIGTVNLEDGTRIENAVLVYDTINSMFYLRDKIPARVFSRFIDENNVESLYFGTNDGKVLKIDDGNTAEENPIHMNIRTAPHFRQLGRNITVSKIGIFMDRPDGTRVQYRTYPYSKFDKSLGTVTKEAVQWFEPKDAVGPIFQMEFTHSNTKTRPTLLGYTIEYHMEGKKNE